MASLLRQRMGITPSSRQQAREIPRSIPASTYGKQARDPPESPLSCRGPLTRETSRRDSAYYASQAPSIDRYAPQDRDREYRRDRGRSRSPPRRDHDHSSYRNSRYAPKSEYSCTSRRRSRSPVRHSYTKTDRQDSKPTWDFEDGEIDERRDSYRPRRDDFDRNTSICSSSRPLRRYDDICSPKRPRYVNMEDSDPRDYHAFAKSEFKPGIIIRAPLHEEDFNRTPRPCTPTTPNSSHISHTTFGAVYSENRFFIVVETYSTHYLAVPLFTYSGTGLKGHQDAHEYASIEDHRYPGTSCREAKHFLVTGELKEKVKPMRPKSVAHLTYPVSRKYGLHVSYQGRLREEDGEELGRLFRARGDL